MAKVLMVIAQQNFRDEELFQTKEELEKAGHSTVIASSSMNESTGMLGGKAMPKIKIDGVSEPGFQAIVFVGGTGAASYFNSRFALGLAKKFASAGKVVAAICIAPSILANAGLLKGKRATAYQSEKDNLEDKGAQYTGAEVESDGMVVTANGPEAARSFGRKIAEMLA